MISNWPCIIRNYPGAYASEHEVGLLHPEENEDENKICDRSRISSFNSKMFWRVALSSQQKSDELKASITKLDSIRYKDSITCPR